MANGARPLSLVGLPEVLREARNESMPHLRELHTRMSRSYSVQMLDAILHHLRPGNDNLSPSSLLARRSAAEFSITTLHELPTMCAPSQKPATLKRLVMAVEGIAESACALLGVNPNASLYVYEIGRLPPGDLRMH
ncbi:hypothetical protein NMY22_g1750 [Coprinellus aureogranulatus]|nr:hypothetical protein NMY22_g1750 [Coprinellus aureogranulatus]